jgi:hypothetical protein
MVNRDLSCIVLAARRLAGASRGTLARLLAREFSMFAQVNGVRLYFDVEVRASATILTR